MTALHPYSALMKIHVNRVYVQTCRRADCSAMECSRYSLGVALAKVNVLHRVISSRGTLDVEPLDQTLK